jgi:hypothetical protein
MRTPKACAIILSAHLSRRQAWTPLEAKTMNAPVGSRGGKGRRGLSLLIEQQRPFLRPDQNLLCSFAPASGIFFTVRSGYLFGPIKIWIASPLMLLVLNGTSSALMPMPFKAATSAVPAGGRKTWGRLDCRRSRWPGTLNSLRGSSHASL